MSKFKTFLKLCRKNRRGLLFAIFTNLIREGAFNWMEDKTYLSLFYWITFGEKIDWTHPCSYNEKLQWLKLNDHNPIYPIIVDKLKMKDWVTDIIGSGYTIPTLGIWDNPCDIDFDSLPNQFVLKWNHDSGSIVVCKDKNTFDKKKALKKLQHGAKVNGFWYGREWPYIKVQPKVFAEEYMEDSKTKELRDYKIFTFNGKAKLLLIASERQKMGVDTKFDFFDMKLRNLKMRNQHENAKVTPLPPTQFETMRKLAETLSHDFIHLRVDFYEVNSKIYIGELTLYHGSGFMTFSPESWYQKLGDYIKLPIS